LWHIDTSSLKLKLLSLTTAVELHHAPLQNLRANIAGFLSPIIVGFLDTWLLVASAYLKIGSGLLAEY
jgi:hypothetical protein